MLKPLHNQAAAGDAIARLSRGVVRQVNAQMACGYLDEELD